MSRIVVLSLCLCLWGIAAQGQPAGELAARINLAHQRFTQVTEPAFSDDFILADVKLDPAYPRRFDEFSGDISGRFIGAVSMMSNGAEDDAWLHRLVAELLKHQRSDGRFGKESLSFAAADVGPDQMALLWGNGRLLVGLLEYHQRFPERKEALEAAVRLGDFLLRVFDDCAKPEVIERLRGKAANGFICFTQFNEGLELLARATGNGQYRDTARKMEPLLETRGDQHTHGYLTTLRGHMMIYESTGETALLDAVKARYQDLLDSGSVMINGGLLEYFKPDYNRDEGCSEADFLRLCLQLWKATDDARYLTQAERCLYNIFGANQFETGDFGHRCYDGRGYVGHPGAGRAWWCCTMHGHRAFRDVLDAAVTPVTRKMDDGRKVTGASVNLYMEGRWSIGGTTLLLERVQDTKTGPTLVYKLTVEQCEPDAVVVLRHPEWAAGVSVNRRSPVSPQGEGTVKSEAHGGTRLENVVSGESTLVFLDASLRFVDRKNREHAGNELPKDAPKEMAIFCGPWLMGVDAHYDPMFHGEPYDNNVLLIPDGEGLEKAAFFDPAPESPLQSGPRLRLTYRHGGFPDPCTVVMRPVAEQTAHPQCTVSFWHQVQRMP